MRRFAFGVLAMLALLLCAGRARAQTYLPIPADSYGFCIDFPQTASASCTVTVYDAGTLNLSTIYSTNTGGAQLNPFTAGTNGTWRFYGLLGNSYDIRISGGVPAIVPYTITNVSPSGSFSTAPAYTVFGNCTNATASPGFCLLVNAMIPAPGSAGQMFFNSSNLFAPTSGMTWNDTNRRISMVNGGNSLFMSIQPGTISFNAGGGTTAPYISTAFGAYDFIAGASDDINIGQSGNNHHLVLSGSAFGTMKLGEASAAGIINLNDGTSGAGVFQGPLIRASNSTPEGSITGRIGSLFLRTDGSNVGTTAYLKEVGTGNTGWKQFAMQDDVQTITNKALSDGSTTVVNSSDATKKVAFNNASMSGSTTETITPTATANRILTLPDASITVSGLTAYSCGTTTTCANTGVVAPHMIYGNVALSSGTPSTATVASIAPAFTGTTTYQCTLTDMTTAADNILKVVNTSASSFTITGPDTITDVISYICIGN